MKGDISRQTFRPERHYSGVRMQQGRVQLDADWNEQVDLQAHRDRANAVDVIGPSGAPKGPSFQLDAAALAKDVLIAPGRFWVGGLLCELETTEVAVTGFPAGNNVVQVAATIADGRPFRVGEWVAVSSGGAPSHFRIRAVNAAARTLTFGASDDVKTPFSGKTATLRRVASYTSQPYLPTPPLTAASATPGLRDLALPSKGIYLAYLEVWERHVTAIEDGLIREKALGGPDTATRSQLVWQVKLLRAGDLGDTVDCEAALPAAPAPGPLRARAQRTVTSDDPCIADPKAGYSRLENQLYRVEIHQGGTLKNGASTGSPITFKWSRDNGSVALPWAAASGKKLTLSAPGRDRALGLAAGQWIELSDDTRDLDGTPGTLVQIDTVSGDDVTVLSGAAINLTDYPVSPRVRRWDGQDAGGLAQVARDETVNEGYLELESGVEARFEDGEYRTGDYWLVPARVVTGDVEWPQDPGGDPLPRAPEGIVRQLAPVALLSWDATTLSLLEDCRPQFPPLTHLCADDICVEGTPCGPDVETVQDALDKLCEAQDLRFHNQHLHGWGVVCGLQLHCCPKEEDGDDGDCHCKQPGECVALEAGYAIDPTGADIRIPERVSVPLAELIEKAGLATRDQEGKLPDVQVSVVLQRDGTVAVEKYVAESLWDRLEGTMLRDLVEECLAPLVTFVQEELIADPDEKPAPLVSPAQKRLTTFVNLLWQIVNAQWGGAMFLSGLADPKEYPEGDDREDFILRVFFQKLRDLLSSKTFCGMYEGVDYPAYDVLKATAPANVARPETIFGNALDNKLRVNPNGKLLYSFGSGNVIRVYDHDSRKMIQELAFPASDAVVQDLAFSPNGTTVYATGLMGKDKVDSMFAVATLDSAGQHTFKSGAVTVCDVPWVTLETSAHVEGKVFAVARGPIASHGGLYVIDPSNVNPTPTAAVAFNAVGPFVIGDRANGAAFGYACASSGTTATSTYDRVLAIDLKATGTTPRTYVLPSSGDDDLAVAHDENNNLRNLYVVVKGAQTNKVLLQLDDDDAAVAPKSIDLGSDTAIRLAYDKLVGRLFLTYEDQYYGRVLEPGKGTLSTDLHPLQIGPIAVRVAKGGERWVVLEYFSRTLTSIPARWTSSDGVNQVDVSVIDRTKLIAYRKAALEAFFGLLGRFLQYLKDCVCDRFLIECPKDEGQKIYLGAVSFKDGKVWQICDFDRRRYVYSFPSVKYWASLVPILPFVKMALEKVCCQVLPPLFDKMTAPSMEKEAPFKTSSARTGYMTFKSFNLASLFTEQKGKATEVKGVAATWYGAKAEEAKVGPTANTVSTDALVGTSAQDAELKAKAMGMTVVSAKPLDPVKDPIGSLGAAIARKRIKPGTAVELVTDASGVVRYVRPVEGRSVDGAAVAGLRKSYQETAARAAAAEERASSLDQEIEVLKLASLEREARVTRLTNKLTDVAEQADRRAKEVSELRSALTEMRKAHEEAQTGHRQELARISKELKQLRERPR